MKSIYVEVQRGHSVVTRTDDWLHAYRLMQNGDRLIVLRMTDRQPLPDGPITLRRSTLRQFPKYVRPFIAANKTDWNLVMRRLGLVS